jgi:deoxyribonuclease V
MKQLHPWQLSPNEAVHLQHALTPLVVVCPLKRPLHLVAGVDISYSKGDDRLFAAVVVMELETLEILEITSHVERATFPYIPGLLAFREIPPLLKAFQKLQLAPDVVVCDGQGIAHMRGMGLAAHLGLWLEIPTIGCAKTRLVGEYEPPPLEKGEQSPLLYKEQIVGAVLRSKKGSKPLFISPGHLIDNEASVALVKKCLGRFRLPEPTRQAHLAVNRFRQHSAAV